MLSITNKPFMLRVKMLNVVMLGAVMLGVVAPLQALLSNSGREGRENCSLQLGLSLFCSLSPT